jgi:hypothetical protein
MFHGCLKTSTSNITNGKGYDFMTLGVTMWRP